MSRTGPKRSVAAVLALLAVVGCERAIPERGERRFADLEAFAAEAQAKAPRPRVIVIGIDGASWDYIDPLIEAGALPNLARIRRDGASGRLRSVDCYFTPPAWTTMLSGQLPVKSGVYSFGDWDAQARAFRTVSARDVAVPGVWDVASAAGLRVAAVGVPVTYPARALNGVMVGGLETPKNHGPRLAFESVQVPDPPPIPTPRSFAPPIAAALEDPHNALYAVLVDTSDDDTPNHDRVLLHVAARGDGASEATPAGDYQFPVGEFSPWIRVRAERDGHLEGAFLKLQLPLHQQQLGFRASPAFFQIEQPYTYPPTLAAELAQQFGYYLPHEFLSLELIPSAAQDSATAARWFLEKEDWDLFLFVFGESDNAHHLIGFDARVQPVYETIDALLGELLAKQSPETTLVVVSDHGFGPYEVSIDLNRFLASLGLLRWRKPGVVDHDASLVFHHMWHLYFDPRLVNEEELTRRGVEIRAGETPRRALMRHISEAAQKIHADDGRALPITIVALPEDAVGAVPDMAVTAHPPGVWVEFWNLQHPNESIVSRLGTQERWKHARDGIVAFYGSRVEPGDLGSVAIQDVAPTLLDLLGLPIADDLDGRPIPGVLNAAAAQTALARVPSYPPHAPVPEDPEGAGFEETLRALGYLRD